MPEEKTGISGNKLKDFKFYDPALSWLSFNYRVLQEAGDKSLPLFERIRFLSIYKANLEKFYQTGLTAYRILLEFPYTRNPKEETINAKILNEINVEIERQEAAFETIFSSVIINELNENGIRIIQDSDPLELFGEFTKKVFYNDILPFLQPVLIKSENTNFIKDNALYLAVELRKGKSLIDEIQQDNPKRVHALIKIPTEKVARFLHLPSPDNKKYVVFIEDLIRKYLPEVFPLYLVKNSFSFISIRNSKLKIEDEFKRKHANRLLKKLTEKKADLPARFIYDRNIPDDFLKILKKTLNISKKDMFSGFKYQKLSDLVAFPNLLKPIPDPESQVPLHHSGIDRSPSFIKAIKKEDFLLHFPYHKFDYVIRFFNEAAIDPKVEEIKTTQYKLESNVAIVNSLISASLNGKKVSVFVDFKARFDDSANLSFIERMVEAGIQVIPSIPGYKIHAKAALVIRRNSQKEDKKRIFAYFSTGNFNEKTALQYCDHAYFTSNAEIVDDLKKLFAYLEKPQGSLNLSHLIVPKFNFKESFKSLIDHEIKCAKDGNNAYILLKTNNLEDKKLIKKLYEASLAGVKIDLIVRGICCLVPDEFYSKNIRVIRIIDKYLEHSRIYMFYHSGKQLLFLSSADLMKPDLTRRIDIMVPIYDETVKKELTEILQFQLADNVKARILGSAPPGWKIPEHTFQKIQSQIETYNHLKNIHH